MKRYSDYEVKNINLNCEGRKVLTITIQIKDDEKRLEFIAPTKYNFTYLVDLSDAINVMDMHDPDNGKPELRRYNVKIQKKFDNPYEFFCDEFKEI